MTGLGFIAILDPTAIKKSNSFDQSRCSSLLAEAFVCRLPLHRRHRPPRRCYRGGTKERDRRSENGGCAGASEKPPSTRSTKSMLASSPHWILTLSPRRVGRYESRFPVGEVTCLDSADLPLLHSSLKSPSVTLETTLEDRLLWNNYMCIGL
ncbi:uncharacterized protein LOC133735150 isoform X2 [Rosa rugosa]|uniref:uncharacterized protein LOC133735150 isoform X2 n=1 Tax=Rosa rugosa TaxID=74645 RepID=UPI002B414290|nr:uncharacterized protein LOC133735150 isoform X2 [Rosa rugosa]